MPEIFPRPFGRYTLLDNLAQGGMGALYVACQGEAGMEKLCVIKTVLPHLADKEYVARFRDEAKVVVRLSHGNLVPVFDAGLARVDGSEELYLAMDYVDGKDLRAVWNRCAQKGIAFPVDVAVYIARELCRGLHHAHSASGLKLVHRDVSPPNVLLSFSGEVKLTDFGLAASTMKSEKTLPGVIYGKVSYMSPEQARGEPLDGRTDLYAVGVILWELLTGRQLFPQTETNLIARVRAPRIQAPSEHAARVSSRLDQVVLKALAPDRAERYPHCEAFRAALSEYLAETAPRTDNARVTDFLEQLFGSEIADERAARQQRIEEVHKARPPGVAALPTAGELPGADRTPTGVLGSYLDGRYLVKRLIGEGGMGLVYEAEHVEIGRRVAIKILHAVYSRQGEVVARFRSEARAATRIGHPHIIDVFDSGTTAQGAVYFVMEFLDGRDLAAVLDQARPLTIARSLAIAREIAQALAAAHKAGIVHRDLKPENVFLVERDGRQDFVKVLDFGIAKTVGESEPAGPLTRPNVTMGTPEYMAPEQAAGHSSDARVDIYALGAMLYEMITGHTPHQGANVLEILTRKANQPVKRPSLYRPDVSAEVERLVLRMLALNPAERPQSMEHLAEELGRFGGSLPSAIARAASGPLAPARGRGALVLALVVACTALVSGAAWVGLRAPEAPDPRSPVVPAARVSLSSSPLGSVPPAAPVSTESETRRLAPVRPAPARPSPSRSVPARPATPHKNPATLGEGNSLLTDARLAVKEGHAALTAGRYGEAEAHFRQAEASGLERGAALAGMAEVAFQRGQYPDAVERARRALVAGGGVPARMLLGNSYFKLKKYDQAIEQYRAILQIDRGQVEAQNNLAAAEKKRNGGS